MNDYLKKKKMMQIFQKFMAFLPLVVGMAKEFFIYRNDENEISSMSENF